MKAHSAEKTVPIKPQGAWIDPSSSNRLRRMILLLSTIDLIIAANSLIISVQYSAPRPLILSAVAFIFFILNFLIDQQWGIKDPNARIYIPVSTFQITLVLFSAIYAGTGLPSAGIILISALIFASTIQKGDQAEKSITLSLLVAGIAALVGSNAIIPQLDIPYLVNASLVFLGILIVAAVLSIVTERITPSIRIKLIIAAIAIVIFPLALMNFIDGSYLRSSLQEQANQALLSSANLMAGRIDEFVKTNRASINSEARLPVFANYVELSPEKRDNSAQEQRLEIALSSFQAGLKVKEHAYLVSYALLDRLGKVVYSTSLAEAGGNERNKDYFLEPTRTGRPFSSAINFSPDGQSYIYFSDVVKNDHQNILGVLRVKFDARILQSYAMEYSRQNGTSAYPILLDENYLRLAEPVNQDLLYTTLVPLENNLQIKLSFAGRLPPQTGKDLSTGQYDIAGKIDSLELQPFFLADVEKTNHIDSVAAVRLTSNPWVVLFLQDQQYILGVLEDQNRRSTLIAVLIAGSISILATFLSRSFSLPISALTETAQQITTGNLDAKADVQSRDELGLLGNAFNTMTARLQEMVVGLEDRVRERTHELAGQNQALAFRARQLETIAEVARGAARAQELETLLKNVTGLISQRFNFYHVGIFLVDSHGEYAVLRAVNSEGGQRMLARQHRLRVGQIGIVGYVTEQGQARIALDVGQDAVYFNNPDLPQTRSEMALPLKLGERVIGALDVQSIEADAFTTEDTQLFSILADQIAIAIYNNQLYSDAVQALAEAQSTHRKYLQQVWDHEIQNQPHSAYHYSADGITTGDLLEGDEIEMAIEAGEPVMARENDNCILVTIPIRLRGETIGIIRIKENSPREWADDEIQTVSTIADQVGLALENARLFTQTVRRAERERKVLEITSRIRSTNDPAQMLQIAAEELQRTLKASRAQVILQPADPAVNGEMVIT